MGILALVISIISVILTVVAITLMRRKRLGWIEESKTDLGPHPQGGKYGFKILYKEVEIKKPKLMILKVRNIGNTAIKADDWDSRLRIILPSGSELLEVEILEDLHELVENVSECSSSLEFKLRLLNPGDYFRVQLLFDSECWDYRILARAADLTILKSNEFLWGDVRFFGRGIVIFLIASVISWISFGTESVIFIILAAMMGMFTFYMLFKAIPEALLEIRKLRKETRKYV